MTFLWQGPSGCVVGSVSCWHKKKHLFEKGMKLMLISCMVTATQL